MYFKFLLVFTVCLSVCSCEFLQKKTGLNLKEFELDTVIDIHSIDEFPAFVTCDSILDISQKSRCFKNNLYKHFSSILLEHTFTSTQSIHETVKVKLRINKNGKPELVKIDSVSIIKKEIPILDSLIRVSVENLPKLIPAKKRGIFVATEYIIPIRIDLD